MHFNENYFSNDGHYFFKTTQFIKIRMSLMAKVKPPLTFLPIQGHNFSYKKDWFYNKLFQVIVFKIHLIFSVSNLYSF